jgi:uncharacterized protein
MIVRELWRYPVKSMAGERLEQSDVGPNGFRGDRGWAVRDAKTGEIHNAKRFPRLMQCAAAYRDELRDDSISHVDVTFPDGTTAGSDSPALNERLSELMGHAVTLESLRPATDRAFYRRRDPGSAVMGSVAKYRPMRKVLSWAAAKGLAGANVRAEFGREADEAMPDLSDIPAEIFEYYTPPGTYFDVYPIHVLSTASLDRMRRHNPNADWDPRRFRPNVLIDDGDESQWVGRTAHIGAFGIRGEIPTVRCAMPMHAQHDLPKDPTILRTIVRDANQCLGLYASVTSAGHVRVGDPVLLR